MPDAANPLTEQDYQNIVDSLRQLDLAEEGIRKAKEAGVNVAGQEALARDHRQKLLNLKRVYFPNRP